MNRETPATDPKVRPQCSCGCNCGKPPVTNILGRTLCEACCMTAMRRITLAELRAVLAAHEGGEAVVVTQDAGPEIRFSEIQLASRLNALERRVEVLERLPVVRSIPE